MVINLKLIVIVDTTLNKAILMLIRPVSFAYFNIFVTYNLLIDKKRPDVN